MKSFNIRSIVVVIIAVLILWYLFSKSGSSGYTSSVDISEVKGMDADMSDKEYAPAQVGSSNGQIESMCSGGVGLSSALLPHEMASQEDYSQFNPKDILKGQNFLSPRDQIGWPETIGGTIRNATYDIRSEPIIPKKEYTWNNSTINPDIMRRGLGELGERMTNYPM